jgi:hypothetical protein
MTITTTSSTPTLAAANHLAAHMHHTSSFYPSQLLITAICLL